MKNKMLVIPAWLLTAPASMSGPAADATLSQPAGVKTSGYAHPRVDQQGKNAPVLIRSSLKNTARSEWPA